MSQRLILSALVSAFLLAACAPQTPSAIAPGQTFTQTPSKGVMHSALLKRTLQLQKIDGQVVPVAAIEIPAEQSFGLKQIAVAEPIMATRPAIGIAPGYYYGGHDFNQYSIQYAEENVYPAAQGNTLLQVYNQSIKPILNEWDSAARLIESRANVNGQEEEYIYLPGKDGEPLRYKPLFVYRFASTPKKETLNVYVLNGEIRAHRMVWGEPQIEIGKVKIDSDKALEIARKAFADRNTAPGYPVYPTVEDTKNGAEVIYNVPQDLQWQLTLSQQSRDQIRYYLNFNYRQPFSDADLPKPMPVPQIDPASPDAEAARKEELARSSMPYPGDPYHYLYGSVEIDAITGEIKNLNRPVIYRAVMGGGASAGSEGSGMVSVDPMPASPPVAVDAVAVKKGA